MYWLVSSRQGGCIQPPCLVLDDAGKLEPLCIPQSGRGAAEITTTLCSTYMDNFYAASIEQVLVTACFCRD